MARETIDPLDAAKIGWDGVQDIVGKQNLGGDLGIFIVNTQLAWKSQFVVADDTPYFFDSIYKKVYEINPRNTRFLSFLASRYGLLDGVTQTKQVASYLQAYALVHGIKRETRRFSYFDRKESALYVNRGGGWAWKLDGKEVTEVPNGEGVLFLDNSDTPMEVDIAPHDLLLPHLINDLNFAAETKGGLTAEGQRDLLTTWLHTVPFGDLFPAKPILLIEGAMHSGKSICVQRFQTLFNGRIDPLIISKQDEEDFGIQLLHSNPVAHLDNMDSDVGNWLRDAICAYATAGGWRKRKKFTDMEIIEIKPSCFLAITTGNPAAFRRADVVDRCIVLRLEERKHGTTSDADVVLQQVRDERPKLFGEWLYNVNKVLAAVRDVPTTGYTNRLAGFERYFRACHKALNFESKVFGTHSPLETAQAERDALTTEDDPLLDLLDRWLERIDNVGREIKAADLYVELAPLAAATTLPFYDSPRALAQRLKTAKAALQRHFMIEVRMSSAQTAFYTFRRLDKEGCE